MTRTQLEDILPITSLPLYLQFMRTAAAEVDFNLTRSGVPESAEPVIQQLGRSFSESGPSVTEGESIAQLYGLTDPATVQAAYGASGGVYAVIAAHSLMFPELKVAIETPAYSLFGNIAELLKLTTVDFHRQAPNYTTFQIGSLESCLEDGAKLICLTNPHNPTGVMLDGTELAAMTELCEKYDATLLIDEVFRDFTSLALTTAFNLDRPIITTNSLTKSCGWGAHRMGWVCAPGEMLARVSQVGDLTHGRLHPSVSGSLGGAIALAPAKVASSRNLADLGRRALDDWLRSIPELDAVGASTTGYVQLRLPPQTNCVDLASHLIRSYSVAVVPGDVFGHPGTIRVGVLGGPDTLVSALERLSQGLTDLLPDLT